MRTADVLAFALTGWWVVTSSVGAVWIRRRRGVLLAPGDRSRVVVNDAPLSVLMDEHVGRDQPAAAEVLLADHQGGFTEVLDPWRDAPDRRRRSP